MLTQSEADALFAMSKKPKSSDSYTFPHAESKLAIEFVSLNGREIFLFDINRAGIKMTKCTYQKLARQIEILRRLDKECCQEHAGENSCAIKLSRCINILHDQKITYRVSFPKPPIVDRLQSIHIQGRISWP